MKGNSGFYHISICLNLALRREIYDGADRLGCHVRQVTEALGKKRLRTES